MKEINAPAPLGPTRRFSTVDQNIRGHGVAEALAEARVPRHLIASEKPRLDAKFLKSLANGLMKREVTRPDLMKRGKRIAPGHHRINQVIAVANKPAAGGTNRPVIARSEATKP